MPTTYWGSWGLGVLGTSGQTTWVANINPGGVWHFWVDNTTISYQTTRVRVQSVVTERQGNVQRVRVTVANWGTQAVGFRLLWSAVYP